MMFGIYPIVAKHFKMFFGDVDNEFLNEVQSRNGFSNSFIVFVSGVMKGYIFAVISINTRCGNNRSAEVSADVFNGDIRRISKERTEGGLNKRAAFVPSYSIHFWFF